MGAVERENSCKEDPDIFSLYLESMGNPSVYTRAEEREAFHKYNSGLAMAKATISSELFQQNPTLFLPKLQASIDSAREAFESIVLHNQKLVISIAKRRYAQVPLLDKIQNGNIGLFIAIDKFDASLGNKFSTYATPWIKNKIFKLSMIQVADIQIPINEINDYIKLKKFQTSFLQMHGHEPEDEECKCQFGWSQKKLDRVIQAGTINKKVLDLDSPISDKVNSITFGDTVSDSQLNTSRSIEYYLYSKGDDDQTEILDYLLGVIGESIESGPKFVSAYIERISFPEISIEALADKYSCGTGELLEKLIIIHTRLREMIGVPKKKFTDYQKKHKMHLKMLAKEYEPSKPDIDLIFLNSLKSSMRGGPRKVAIYIEYNSNKNTTLQDVGLRYGVTRERIRQIVAEVDSEIQLQTKLE
jgi:RNA polymerase sigma factor (sigma-70 family)